MSTEKIPIGMEGIVKLLESDGWEIDSCDYGNLYKGEEITITYIKKSSPENMTSSQKMQRAQELIEELNALEFAGIRFQMPDIPKEDGK